jgi:hypothetical protein
MSSIRACTCPNLSTKRCERPPSKSAAKSMTSSCKGSILRSGSAVIHRLTISGRAERDEGTSISTTTACSRHTNLYYFNTTGCRPRTTSKDAVSFQRARAPNRLRAIEQVLEHEKFMFLLREQCPRAELESIALCHPEEYIERIRRAVPQTELLYWRASQSEYRALFILVAGLWVGIEDRLLAPSYVPPPMPLASSSLPSPTISGDASPIWFRRPLANNPVRTRGTLWEKLPWRAPSPSSDRHDAVTGCAAQAMLLL